jgi:hypothetical protein
MYNIDIQTLKYYYPDLPHKEELKRLEEELWTGTSKSTKELKKYSDIAYTYLQSQDLKKLPPRLQKCIDDYGMYQKKINNNSFTSYITIKSN